MSSGLARLFRRLKTLWAGDSRRVARLAERGKTVFLAELVTAPPPEIVAVDLGFGTEFWAVRSTPIRIESNLEAVRGGRLILEGPARVAGRRAIVEHGLSFRKVHLRL